MGIAKKAISLALFLSLACVSTYADSCSSSSESSSDDCVSAIHKLQENLVCCCRGTHKALDEILEFLEEQFPCEEAIAIDSLPFTITIPGKYCVTDNLSFTGAAGDAAIAVQTSNVIIDFDGHEISINGLARGVTALDVSNVVIKNGIISTPTPSINTNSDGVRLERTENIVVDSMIFRNTRRGINAGTRGTIVGVLNLHVLKSTFNLPSAPTVAEGITVELSQGVVIDTCVFEQIGGTDGGGFAMTIADTSDIHISNSSVLNTNGLSNAQALFIQAINRDVSNIIVENSEFDNCFRVFVLSATGPDITSVIIKNCTATNVGNLGLAFSGQGLLAENCVLIANPANSFDLVVLGSNRSARFKPARDVLIKDSVFVNRQALPTFNCIEMQYAEGVIIDSCIIESNPSGQFTPVAFTQPPSANIKMGGFLFDAAGAIVPNSGANVNNVRVTNSQILGNAQFGIVSVTGAGGAPNKDIVIEHCVVDGSAQAGIYFTNTETSVVRNCHVKNVTGNVFSPGHGIVLAQPFTLPFNQAGVCRYNEISYCTVARCTGTGILIEAGQQYNFVTHNETFSNDLNGIENQGDETNQFYENASCNNCELDCVGNIPHSLIGHPGTSDITLRLQ